MDARFAAAIEAAAEQAPMSNGSVSTVPGRLLLADGDGLAYYCAGNDDTDPGTARRNMLDKLDSARRACGAERVKILLTAAGSHKGFRYAVARVKPYQGQRADSRRPKNWQYLRTIMEENALGDCIEVEQTAIAEADDLFARYAKGHPDCVTFTQDKDMHMVPGWHLDWLTHIMLHVPAGCWHKAGSDVAKPFGRVFFWLQMLQGDGADNIPGLPYYTDGSILKSGANKGQLKQHRIGEPAKDTVGTAFKMLKDISSDMGAILHLRPLYESCYGKEWLLNMLEQGILLWMRDDPTSSALNVVAKGNPLHALTTHELYPAAKAVIMARIAEAMVHEETEDDGDSSDPNSFVGATDGEVRSVLATVFGITSGVGSRPFDGADTSSPAPILQCVAGEGGEQLPQVRCAEPARPAAWATRLFAKA